MFKNKERDEGQPDSEQAKKRDKKQSDDYDDGATVADMNIDGMPWFVRRKYKKDAPVNGSGEEEQLSPELMRAYRWAAVKAALIIILVFGVVFFLFIAFCDFVWFK